MSPQRFSYPPHVAESRRSAGHHRFEKMPRRGFVRGFKDGAIACSSGPVFFGQSQQLIVEVLAEEERRFEQLVEFGTNRSHVALSLCFQQ